MMGPASLEINTGPHASLRELSTRLGNVEKRYKDEVASHKASCRKLAISERLYRNEVDAHNACHERSQFAIDDLELVVQAHERDKDRAEYDLWVSEEEVERLEGKVRGRKAESEDLEQRLAFAEERADTDVSDVWERAELAEEGSEELQEEVWALEAINETLEARNEELVVLNGRLEAELAESVEVGNDMLKENDTHPQRMGMEREKEKEMHEAMMMRVVLMCFVRSHGLERMKIAAQEGGCDPLALKIFMKELTLKERVNSKNTENSAKKKRKLREMMLGEDEEKEN